MTKVFKKLYCLFYILIVIINSGYALSTIYPSMTYSVILGTVFLMPIILKQYKNKLNILSTSLILLLSMIFCTFIVSGFRGIATYALLAFNIILAFGIVIQFDFYQFIEAFLKIMKYVSIISIVGYIFLNVIKVFPNLPSAVNINNVEYGIGYVFSYIKIIPDRNCGIFWEPGLFATFLVIAIVCELYFVKRKADLFSIIIYIIAVLTTKSAAGYGLLILVAVLFILKHNNKKSIINFIFSLILFIISLIVILNYSTIIENTSLSENEVIKRLELSNVSESSRALALKHNLDIMMKSPIFGVGIYEASLNMKNYADTSNFTYLLSTFGIFGLQYTIYWIYGILKNNKNTFFVNIVILSIFVLILNKEPHIYNVFSWCFMFYMLKNAKENRGEGINEFDTYNKKQINDE